MPRNIAIAISVVLGLTLLGVVLHDPKPEVRTVAGPTTTVTASPTSTPTVTKTVTKVKVKVKKVRVPVRVTVTAAARSQHRSVPSGSGSNYASGSTVWDRLAQCEASGNWAINTGNGYYGGLQFTLSTWRAYGGTGYPHQASRSTQIAVAQRVQAAQGWGAWPACSSKLGLR